MKPNTPDTPYILVPDSKRFGIDNSIIYLEPREEVAPNARNDVLYL